MLTSTSKVSQVYCRASCDKKLSASASASINIANAGTASPRHAVERARRISFAS